MYQKEPVQKEPHGIYNMDYTEVALLLSICPIFGKLSLNILPLRYVLAIFITKNDPYSAGEQGVIPVRLATITIGTI